MQNIDDSVFIAEGARVVGDVTVGKDSSIWFNAVLRGDEDRSGKRSHGGTSGASSRMYDRR